MTNTNTAALESDMNIKASAMDGAFDIFGQWSEEYAKAEKAYQKAYRRYHRAVGLHW